MFFFQDGPVLSNLYTEDNFLKREFTRRVPKEIAVAHAENLERLGAVSATKFPAWQIAADQNPPKLTQFDPWGRRIDHIEEARHWQDFKKAAVEWNIVGRGHDMDLGPHVRTVQMAYMLLFAPTTANYLCPLAMSDAAACVLRQLAPKPLKERLYARLLSGNLDESITSGQWMTERTGGSDVSQSETVAHFKDNSGEEARYKLNGVKWFSSSITSEMSLLLAQVKEGDTSKGLTLFCWERQDMPGCGPEHRVNVLRLKDKLGTRALPTAEIELNGTLATQIGEVGRGVSHISEMLNITRFYNAVASAAGMNYSTLLVADYAQKRNSFGRSIGEHALMRSVISDLNDQASAATALCFEVASLIGLCESKEASKDQQLCMRAMVPLAKLVLGKAAVAHASETLECFGGAGYIEDTGLPRILRDAQVLPIWEGTTNILALDIWRAENKEGALSALVSNIIARTLALTKHGNSHADENLQKAQKLAENIHRIKAQDEASVHGQLRRIAFETGEALQKLLMLEHST